MNVKKFEITGDMFADWEILNDMREARFLSESMGEITSYEYQESFVMFYKAYEVEVRKIEGRWCAVAKGCIVLTFRDLSNTAKQGK